MEWERLRVEAGAAARAGVIEPGEGNLTVDCAPLRPSKVTPVQACQIARDLPHLVILAYL